MSYHPGKFVWFEHLSSDLPRARRFYEQLFGWHVENMPLGESKYDMIMNGETGIGGLGQVAAGLPASWMSYVSVPDVDAVYRAALAAGATSRTAPTDYGPVGRGCAIADPTGAAVSLWKSAQEDRADVQRTPVGAWAWNELWTRDPDKALAFYAKLLGYTHDTMDMGQGPYFVLKTGDVPRGGIMKNTDAKLPSMWLPYVEVADCDASAAKARKLGANAVVAPTDIPDIGRFSVLIDPQGAAIGIIKGAA